jgi:hypothetical protein
MSEFLTKLIDEDIDSRYFQLHEPLRYKSTILNRIIEVPAGFVYDHESVPIIKGTSNRGGCIHDYLCRCDSDPIVTKQQAASVYFEAMECVDTLKGGGFNMWWRRWVKSSVVRVATGYFHKFSVFSTYAEIRG